MTDFKNDETTGSLDTNIRLLAQRVNKTEIDLHRLGDSVRDNTRDLQGIIAESRSTERLLNRRLEDIEDDIKAIKDDAKDVSNKVWGVILILIGTVLAVIREYFSK